MRLRAGRPQLLDRSPEWDAGEGIPGARFPRGAGSAAALPWTPRSSPPSSALSVVPLASFPRPGGPGMEAAVAIWFFLASSFSKSLFDGTI